MQLRGPQFAQDWAIFRQVNASQPPAGDAAAAGAQRKLRIAIMHTGAPAAGMNSAARAAVRLALARGDQVFGVYDGFEGLVNARGEWLTWMSVNDWANEGGAMLGTNRTQPHQYLALIATTLERLRIDAVLNIGGFEAFTGLLELAKQRSRYRPFCIPMVVLPATISNNVPGTEISLGTDTATNQIMEAVDIIKQSASASRRRYVPCGAADPGAGRRD